RILQGTCQRPRGTPLAPPRHLKSQTDTRMARLSKIEIEAHRKGRPAANDASREGPDPGRSAERESQDRVLDHTARRDSWLTHLWRALKHSTGRPSSRP